MPYEITISGIDTTFTKCIDWVTCKVDTPSTSNARTNFVGNYMNISGFIGTDEVTIDLYKWSILPVNDSNVFRNVQLTVKDANDNVIEKVSFPNAFVEFYRESYMRDNGFGKFDLQLKQKIDKNGDVGVSDSSADEKGAAGSKVLESVLGNAPKSGILGKEVSEAENKLKPSNNPNPYAIPNGPRTKISKKADEATKRSLERENEAADIFAKNGYEIEQNPKVEGTTREPDYRIEGELADCYSPSEKSSVRRIGDTIREKVVDKKQAGRIVLNLKDWNGNISDIVEQLNNYPVEGLEEVIVIEKDNSIVSIYP